MPASAVRPPRTLVIRLDANPGIGSGHVMRCLSIARGVEALGWRVVFAVSDEVSAAFVRERGGEATVVGGDPFALGRTDGETLASYCHELNAPVVLADTYGVTADFFAGLRAAEGNPAGMTTPGAGHARLREPEYASYMGQVRPGVPRVAYIDDLYTFELGKLTLPMHWDVDVVIDYTVGVSEAAYRQVYGGVDAELLVGPRFAPIRPQFRPPAARGFACVRRILVTTGSTNPERALERMVGACPSGPGCPALDVVVGSQADFDEAALGDRPATVHRGVGDLSPLMRACDMAVSAAGTTTLEMLACGLPAVVVPLVDNQRANAEGLAAEGLALAAAWDAHASRPEAPASEFGTLSSQVARLCGDEGLRRELSARGTATVDGCGARRTAEAIVGRKRTTA